MMCVTAEPAHLNLLLVPPISKVSSAYFVFCGFRRSLDGTPDWLRSLSRDCNASDSAKMAVSKQIAGNTDLIGR
jgi:hypothetical protein